LGVVTVLVAVAPRRFFSLSSSSSRRFSLSAVSCDVWGKLLCERSIYRPEGTPRTLARARAAACPPGSACLCAPGSLLVPLVSVPAAGRDAPVSPPRTSDRAGVTRPRRRNVIDPLSYAQQADPATPAPKKSWLLRLGSVQRRVRLCALRSVMTWSRDGFAQARGVSGRAPGMPLQPKPAFELRPARNRLAAERLGDGMGSDCAGGSFTQSSAGLR